MNDWLNADISEFMRVNEPNRPRLVKVNKFLGDIRGGRWKDAVQRIREAAANLQAEAADCAPEWLSKQEQQLKNLKAKTLQAVTPSGAFSYRNNSGLTKHSGLLCLDLDDLNERLAEAKDAIIKDPHTAACFVSPSGTGLKVFVPISEDHLEAFKEAEAYYLRLGYNIDGSCKEVSRLCYGSYDPNIFISEDSPEPFLGQPTAPLHSLPPLFSNPLSESLPKTISISTTTPTSTIQPSEEEDDIDRKMAARQRLEKNPELADMLGLYDKLVAPRLRVEPHKRNQALKDMVPFLHVAVCKEVAGILCRIMLELNSTVFTGSLEEQSTSWKSLWEGCETNYPGSLSPAERRKYERLSDGDKDAFRLFRDLARLDQNGIFFLSMNEAQLRLKTNGQRMLCRFLGLGFLVVVEQGRQRKLGQPGHTGKYRWTIPLPAVEPKAA